MDSPYKISYNYIIAYENRENKGGFPFFSGLISKKRLTLSDFGSIIESVAKGYGEDGGQMAYEVRENIKARWEHLKNYRQESKGISKPYLSVHECDVGLHDHPSLSIPGYKFEVAYVLCGRAIHFTEEYEEEVGAGDCIMIDRGVRHGYRLTDGGVLRLLNSSFDYSDLDRTPSRSRTLTEIARHYSIITDRDSTKPIDSLIFHDGSGKIRAALEDMIREHAEKRPGYQKIAECKMLEIVLTGLREYFCKDLPQSYSPPIQRIIDYMTYGFMSSVPLSAFATEANIPFRILSRLFIKETGMPYTRYVQHRRITEGCALLTGSDESIEFISEYVGFSDPKRFRQRFKELMGMTPREYRRLHLG